MLGEKNFKVLRYIEAVSGEGVKLTQNKISSEINISVGTVNRSLRELRDKDFLSGYTLTQAGLEALEPYRVKRACLIAAGVGSRLIPITLNTPKPLVRVHGVRIIDTLLDAVTAAGIREIYIVRGYLAEQFDQLLVKYPAVKFIDNPVYNETNNISSVLVLDNLIENSYIIESDLLLRKPGLIEKYQYCSNYLGIYTERTDDYYLKTRNGRIIEAGLGGTDCYQTVGISYWTQEDGRKLAGHIREVYDMPGGKENFFGSAATRYHLGEYYLTVRPCSFDDVTEIDTFNELKKIDKAYNI